MNYASLAIESSIHGQMTYCKFLAANDTGKTGGHQAGIYISKPSIPILFDEAGTKGSNKDKWVKINWQDNTVTDTRFIYYGTGTRNEYRITNFGKGFPYLRHEYTGALFVLVKKSSEDYDGFILNTEEEIDDFLDAFGIGPTETNRLIDTGSTLMEVNEKKQMESFVGGLKDDFPPSEVMAKEARRLYNSVHHNAGHIVTDPDRILINWTNTEYRLFKYLEYARYYAKIANGFQDFDSFIDLANQVLNRRKSRAGKSLEHHLGALFEGNHLQFDAQVKTEGNKKPDFMFPSGEAYHNVLFPTDKLTLLAAKTTCKDRWRQVLNEADRLKGERKFLCTLQQGISGPQLDEMKAEKIQLVVPKEYIKTYPEEKRKDIWTVQQFIGYVKGKEA